MNNYQIIGKSGSPIQTDVTLHPGEVLAMEIEARNLKKTEFAGLLHIQPSQLSELLHGKRHISAALAIKLEQILEISAEYWMRLQVAYDLAVERQKAVASA